MAWKRVCAAVLVGTLACGGGSGNPTGGGSGSGSSSGAPSCTGSPMGGVVKVQGVIDGQTVNIDQSPASGELTQISTGALVIPIHVTFNDAAVAVDPGIVQLNLMWATVVPDGSAAAATGAITLPPGGPYAGMALCVGAGSSITPNQQTAGADFVLKGLTLGPACTQAIAGELDGCWGNSF